MYIGAAVFLWLVRAWKIGEDEEMEAVAWKNGEGSATGAGTVEGKSPFLKRIFMIRKV